MRQILGTRFDIVDPNVVPSPSLLDTVSGLLCVWVEKWYSNWMHLAVTIPRTRGTITPAEGHTVEILTTTVDDNSTVWALSWQYPDSRNADLRWHVKTAIALCEGAAELSFSIQIDSQTFEIVPVELEFRPPNLLAQLVEAVPCFLNGRRITSSPLVLTAADVTTFVENDLLWKDRALPLLVLGPDAVEGTSGLDPLRLAKKLTSLATVVVLSDAWAVSALDSALPPGLTCPPDAVRTYWPDLDVRAEPKHHPFMEGRTLRRLARRGQDVTDRFFRQFAEVSAYRFSEGPVFRKVRERTKAAETRRRADLQEKVREGRISNDELRQAVTRLQEEAQWKDARIEDLERENEGLKLNWREFAKLQPTTPEAAARGEEAPAPAVILETVAGAIERAANDFKTNVTVWDSAFRSAQRSHSKRAEEVYNALKAMDEVASEYFQSKRARRSMGSLNDAFRRRGFKYAAQESQTTGAKYAEQRTFRQGDDQRVMERHLTLGGGDRENTVQIYFDPDDATEKFVIGYCGIHLDYARMRT